MSVITIIIHYFTILNQFRCYGYIYTVGFYNISKKEISLSGFSDGGFFGVQFHVAFSETIMGVGIAAGGMLVI